MGTPWKRLCVIDLRTKEKRFEVSRCGSPGALPLLCATTDEGGGNMPIVHFMQSLSMLRVVSARVGE